MEQALIAVLVSGEGTTAEAFIRAGASGHIPVQAALIICNNKKAGAFDRIAGLNQELGLHIPVQLINSKTHSDEEAAIMQTLKAGSFDLIVLMGYMKKIGPRLVHEFGWRHEYTDPRQAMMVNTHPGLLPETKGLYGIHVQEHVLQKGLPYSGQTLHVVAEDYDDGPVIAEHKVAVRSDDTPESLFDRVRETEKNHLPGDITQFIQDRKQFLEGHA